MQKHHALDQEYPVRCYAFELQTFTCRVCKHEIESVADIGGEVAA
jgi:hypothetical protein